ncbi:MAG: NAD-dependent epimerase/dehydratase family protein [Thermoplasmatales archaeon]
MEKMIVSGGNGFLGSHLVKRAIEINMKVTVIDDLSTMNEFNLPKQVELIKSKVEFFSTQEKYDYVVHLASRPSPEDYQKHPVDTIMSNSVGTLNMLNIARNSNAVFLYTSSSEIYGEAGIIPTPESYYGYVNPNGERSCYDEGKRFSEALIMAYNREYDIDVRIERPFNVYGPGIRPDGLYGRVIPRFLLNALKGENLEIFGDGSKTRSFLYVDDWLEATWRFLTFNNLSGQVLNVGSDKELTIKGLAEIIIDLTSSRSRIIYSKNRIDDPSRRAADISRAISALNWKPKIDIKDGLKRTSEWIREKYL